MTGGVKVYNEEQAHDEWARGEQGYLDAADEADRAREDERDDAEIDNMTGLGYMLDDAPDDGWTDAPTVAALCSQLLGAVATFDDPQHPTADEATAALEQAVGALAGYAMAYGADVSGVAATLRKAAPMVRGKMRWQRRRR